VTVLEANRSDDEGARPSLRRWHHLVIFLLACLILASRRPDAIFLPQFRAEDGHVWFADAYNLGWLASLIRTQDGYLQTFSRLGAALSLLIPIALAPLVLNVIAFAAQALPVNLLLCSRSSAWGSLRFRAMLAAIYLGLPSTGEAGLGITESQWLLALSAFLLIVARPPKNRAGWLLDIAFLALSGLSGPFCIFLLPIAVYVAARRRNLRRWAPVWILGISCAIQLFGLLILDRMIRPRYEMGANAALLVRILGGNVFVAALIGNNRLAAMPGPGIFILLLGALLVGGTIAAVCLLKSNLGMRLFLLLSGAIMIASLLAPSGGIPAGVTVWQMLAKAGSVRYWIFPSLAFAWSLGWCVRVKKDALRVPAAVLLGILCLGSVFQWRLPALDDLHYAEYARAFEAAAPGTVMTIPENPMGWEIRLVKHQTF